MELPYIITFEPNNGEQTLTRTTTMSSPFVIDGDLPEVSRTGYQFLGGYKETSGGTEITTDTVFNGDTTVYAQGERETYTVVFKNWDGSVITTRIVSYGSSAPAPLNPTRPETAAYTYTFSHGDKALTNVTQNLDITAIYTETPKIYNITGILNDGTGFSTTTQEYYNDNPTPPPLERTGYTLSGGTPEISLVGGEKTYTANGTPTIYSITYNLNGGTNNPGNPLTYNVETSSITFLEPTKTGYDFVSWTVTDISKGSTGDKTTTANGTLKTYTIRFFDYNISLVQSFEKHYRQNVVLPTPPTRPGYTFDGWYDNRIETTYHLYNGLGTQITGTIVPDLGKSGQEYNFYAKYTPKVYTLHYFDVGFDSSTVTYNEPYNKNELNREPYSREGYTGAGGYDAPSRGNKITSTSLVKVVTTNNYIYAYARGTQNPVYTITFNGNEGTSPDPQSVYSEDEYKLTELPSSTRAGYQFSGGYTAASGGTRITRGTIFSANTIVYAKWYRLPKKDYKDFAFRNKTLSDFNGFIINEGDDLKFFNPSNFSHEFTTPQFSNRSFLTGTSRENREFNFNIFLQEVTLKEYKDFLDGLNPEYKGVLILGYNTDYGYDVKVNSVSEATFYVCRGCKTDEMEDRYNIELEIGFITEKDGAARILNEEHDLSNSVELKGINYDEPYHEIINKQSLENYLIIKFQKSLEIIWHDYEEGRGRYGIVDIVNESDELSATYYSQYGIAILENGNFLEGTISPLVIPPKTSIDKYLIDIDGGEAKDGSIEITSREII